jgi:TolB-like protein
MQHMSAPVPRLPDAYRPLQPLVDRLLAKDARQRYATGADVVAAIDALTTHGLVPVAAGSGATGSATEPTFSQAERLFATSPPGARLRRIAALAVAVLALIVVAGIWSFGQRATPGHSSGRPGGAPAIAAAGGVTLGAIAVLPCVNRARDPDLSFYGDGLAEELIHRLSRLEALPVIGRTSSFAFKATTLSAREIGASLEAEHVLTCAVDELDQALRIGAELIDVETGTQRWSGVYEKRAERAFSAVDEIAVGIAEQLLANLVGTERALLVRHSTRDMRALELYRQSVVAANEWTVESIARARRLAEEALAIDPDFALAHVAIAQAWSNDLQMSQLDPAVVRGPWLAALDAAERIDPDLAEIHAWRGTLAAQIDWDFAAQRRHLERAFLLQPNSPMVNQQYCDSLFFLGPRERSIEFARRARNLDPRNPHMWNYLTAMYWHAFRYEEALREVDASMREFPGQWVQPWMKSAVLHGLGRCDEAVVEAERARNNAPTELDKIETLATLGVMYACAGRTADAERVLAALADARARGLNPPWSSDALILAALGRRDAAHAAARAAFRQPDWRMTWHIVDPWWDGMRSHWGYPELVRLSRLPPEAFAAYEAARASRQSRREP